jgi:hypothetical protein
VLNSWKLFMYDFAHDPEEVRQPLVGRVLTVERVRQLNAKDYFYQMLKDNPEVLKIHPGIENELLEGAIDCHIHAYPDFVPRAQHRIQIAIDASEAKMRALALRIIGTSVVMRHIWLNATSTTSWRKGNFTIV